MSLPAPLRLGLVGLRFGRHLARTLTGLPGVVLAGVADRDATPADLAEIALPPGVSVHREAAALLDQERLDGLVLAVSPKFRAPLLQACVERRLPVFVEKPWAGNPDQARALARLCAPLADRIMVGFSFRFHPAVTRARALLDGALGPAWMANGEYAFSWNLGPDGWLWQADGGGGVFNENSCHLFDTVCHLLGEPRAVLAATHNPRGRPAPELAAVTLTFASGAVAALTLGGLGAAPFSDYPRLDIVAERGRLALRGRGHIWEAVTWAGRDDEATQTLLAPPEVLGQTRYSAALAHFADCLRTGRPPAASLDDGLRAVDLAAALSESAATGRAVAMPQRCI